MMKMRSRISAWTLAVALAIPLWSGTRAAAQEGPLENVPPKGKTVEQVIEAFAAREREFKAAREKYTWRQDVKVNSMDGDTPTGEYRIVFDVLFGNDGKRVENVVFAPQDSLRGFSMSKEDYDDIRNRLPFVLTTEEIPDYNIDYQGHQTIDELGTYVFDVAPKQMQKNRRYFEGRIWVDDRDFQIVMSRGKSVPDVRNKKGEENLFPRFTTYREQIDGKYWFPTYTRADDTLKFSSGDVGIRIIVKYTNYKRFGSQSKIIFNGEEVEQQQGQPPADTQQPGTQQPPAGQQPPQTSPPHTTQPQSTTPPASKPKP
jgi:hypothetical protein